MCSPRFVTKVLCRLAAVAVLALTPEAVFAGYDIYEKDDQKLEIGMRLQPRMEYSRTAASGGGPEWLRDYMIRRARLKLNGKMPGVSFGFEWKIDGTAQNGVTPTAAVADAWKGYPPLQSPSVSRGPD